MNQSYQSIVVRSIHVGHPRTFDEVSDKAWTSSIIKCPIATEVHVGLTNIEGDEQSDLVHHGGIDKAVNAYPAEHYEFWKQEFPHIDWTEGAFGENLSLLGTYETDVCIGDRFGIGTCSLEVSQPRQPCWKLSRRWDVSQLAVRVQETRRTGWYFRVLQEGSIRSGQSMQLIARPYPEWTIDRANQVMFANPHNPDQDRALLACPALSPSWKTTLTKRLANRFEGQ